VNEGSKGLGCAAVRALLDDAIDGLLSAERKAALDRHLGDCPGCRREYEALAAIDRALAEAPVDPAPRWLPSAVGAEIGRRTTVSRSAEAAAIAAAAGAAAVPGIVAVARRIGGADPEAVESTLSTFLSSLGDFAVRATTEAPGLPTGWWESPGVQGVAWGLAIGAVALLTVIALRLPRRLAAGSF